MTGVQFLDGGLIFHHHIQTGSKADRASNPMGSNSYCYGGKVVRAWSRPCMLT